MEILRVLRMASRFVSWWGALSVAPAAFTLLTVPIKVIRRLFKFKVDVVGAVEFFGSDGNSRGGAA